MHQDHGEAWDAQARRRRSGHRRGPAARSRHTRALRAREAGELVHADVKKVARIPDGGGHRALGRDCGSPRGSSRSCLHVAVDDFSRVAYAELLPDERGATCVAFMSRALRFFAGLGPTVERVMTGNGPGYRSGEFNALLGASGARHIYTRPYSPWQNGKVERMNRTVAQKWQYARAWTARPRGRPPSRPSSSATIGSVRTARAGACRPCRASSA